MNQSDIVSINESINQFIAADIGNSRLKLLSGSNFLSLDYSFDWLKSLKKFILHFENKPIIIGYSSVNPHYEEIFVNTINNNGNILFKNIEVLLKKQNIIKYEHIKGIGSDRLAGLLGAMSVEKPPLITIDCGTAITINVVGPSGECLGGTIFAGLKTQIRALDVSTAALKDVELDYEPEICGKDTAHALRSGVITSIAGGIKEIINRISTQEFKGAQIPVFLTGGSSEIISKALADWEITFLIKPRLVLEGILFLMKISNQSK